MGHPEPPDFAAGTAGASARREHDRRRANRENRVRDKHPRVGGLLLALGSQPEHETSWARGAIGEERVAAALAKHLREGVVVLHDRRIPGSRANIDPIAVAPGGVWVIDSKRYTEDARRKPIHTKGGRARAPTPSGARPGKDHPGARGRGQGSVEVRSGHVTGVLGRNDAGESTGMRRSPASGRAASTQPAEPAPTIT